WTRTIRAACTCWRARSTARRSARVACSPKSKPIPRAPSSQPRGASAAWRCCRIGAVAVSAPRCCSGCWRTRGMAQVQLHAQVDATDFYLRHGFEIAGEDFMEAGIPHRPMRMTISAFAAPPRAAPPPRPVARVLSVQTREQLIEATLSVLGGARHVLRILVRELDPMLLDDSACLVELRRIAISGRGALIRVLAQDINRAQHAGNRMLDLAQRLPSVIQFRRPVEDVDREYPSAFMCTDAGGYLFRPVAQRMESVGSTCAPGRAAQLQALFDQIWERSESMSELRP